MNRENSFMDFLKSAKPVALRSDPKKLRAVKPGESLVGISIAPPNVADLRFSRNKYESVKPKLRLGTSSLPESWNNFTNPPGNNDIKYKLSTRPINQGLCGSCFACATSTSISDAFVFGENLNFNPNCSPMFILSCLDGNYKCGGGDSFQTLTDISQKGIVTSHCIDYDSICQNDPSCSMKGNANVSPPSTEQMNSMIPLCGCCAIGKESFCDKQPEHYKYFIKNIKLVATNDDKNPLPDAVEVIKEHIYKYGSAVSGFQVFNNFMGSGTYEETKGIYFETESYGSQNPTGLDGLHAITIVGWGVEKSPITLSTGKTLTNTPYWWVRNSWGRKWGFDGYFKIAMYQPGVNENTALERFNTFTDPNGFGHTIAGVILFEPAGYDIFDSAKSDCSYLNRVSQKTMNDLKDFYCNEQSPKDNIVSPSDGGDKSISDHISNTLENVSYKKILLYGLITLLVLLFLMFMLKGQKRRRKH